ncbi:MULTISPECIES: hypothetical protein [unclassified Microcoleus]|nr:MULTISPECIES: hypothetical protein [unclassified Microcoleus]
MPHMYRYGGRSPHPNEQPSQQESSPEKANSLPKKTASCTI